MYRSKSHGKRGFQIFEPTMHAGALARLELKADLQRALEHDEFMLEYQPIINLASGRVRGVEALVRWQHHTRGRIAPGDFVPMAEETGLIRQIGRWVLRTACEQACEWQHAHPHAQDLAITVNLSARELLEPELVSDIALVLRDTGLPPRNLTLEITESVLMADADAAIERLEALRAIGVMLAVDDFGTGYSSLSYLKRFPIDVVKIAKPFVDDIDKGPEEEALAGAIVQLVETFGMDAVAEGIESGGQADALRKVGCAYGQGFFFSRPVSAAAFGELLARQPPGPRRHAGDGAAVRTLSSRAARQPRDASQRR